MLNFKLNYQPGSNVYQLRTYLNSINNLYGGEWYKRYLLILKYFTNLFQIEGSDFFYKNQKHIIRTAIEYGKVGVVKLNDKLLLVNIVEVEYNNDLTIKKADVLLFKQKGHIGPNQKPTKVPGENIVILQWNYDGLPLVFFWEDILHNVIRLKNSALTGSIASIKKFNKLVHHNDDEITKAEIESYLDPTTPYITTIENPSGYTGDLNKQSLTPNSIVETISQGDTNVLWDNLKNYIDFEYLQNGVRINTNKKSERNIAGEVKAETAIFDIHDQDFYLELEHFKDQVKEKFGEEIEIINLMKKLQEEEANVKFNNNPKEISEVSLQKTEGNES